MIITISDMWKNQQKMLDNDNQIKLSSLIGFLGTKAGKSHAGGALHAKEELGWGGGAHREWCGVGERGDGERLWVSAWCLRKGAGMGV